MASTRFNCSLALIIAVLCGCTFNVRPAVPAIPPVVPEQGMIDCEVTLMVTEELLNSEYLSAISPYSSFFTGPQAHIHVGEPAAEAVEALVRSRFRVVVKQLVKGSGSDDFFSAVSTAALHNRLVMRPRITHVESVARPNRYSLEYGLTVDVAGLSIHETPSGTGTGTAGDYSRAALQSAADEALSGAVAGVASRFPTACK